jgi:hypothetical protein
MAKINAWDAEVDEGSATPTPAKVKPKGVAIIIAPKPTPKKDSQTVPVGQAEVDDGSIGKKKGGMITSEDHVRKHAAGHTFHDDYIKTFGKR